MGENKQNQIFENKITGEGEREKAVADLYRELNFEMMQGENLRPERLKYLLDRLDKFVPLPPEVLLSPEVSYQNFLNNFDSIGKKVEELNILEPIKKTDNRRAWPRILKKGLIAGVVGSLIIMNLTIEAAYNKSIIEIITDAGTSFFINFKTKPAKNNYSKIFGNWKDVELEDSSTILAPQYIPDDFILSSIISTSDNGNWQLIGSYIAKDNESEKYFKIIIYNYDLSNAQLKAEDSIIWTPVGSADVGDKEVSFYTYITDKENLCKAIFRYENAYYILEGDMHIRQMLEIINQMTTKEKK